MPHRLLILALGVCALLVVADAVAKHRTRPAASSPVSTMASSAAPGIANRDTQSVRTPEPAIAPADSAASENSALARLARLAIRKRLRGEGDQTYLDSMIVVTDSLVRRWPNGLHPPLRLGVVEGGSPDYAPRFVGFVRDAALLWERLDVGVGFEMVSDTSTADILVRWIDRFPSDRAGQTDLTWDQTGRIQHAAIALALRTSGGELLPDEALRTVTVHELGHAIGLPHSADSRDIMFPSAVVSGPSQRDHHTAEVLYDLPTGSVRNDPAVVSVAPPDTALATPSPSE